MHSCNRHKNKLQLKHKNKIKVCGICADEIHIDSDINYCFPCRLRDIISVQNYLSSPETLKRDDIKAVF